MSSEDNEYYLDPDYRNEPAKNADGTTQPHCCRCQRPFKKHTSMLSCTVDYETMMVRLSPMGKELIGKDCWELIKSKTTTNDTTTGND